MTPVQRYLPWGVLTLAGIYLAYCALPLKQNTAFELDKFGTLPVVYNGRIQPIDSVARNALMIISARQSFYEELPNGTQVRQPAIRWLMDMWGDKEKDHKVIRIENDQVLALLGLKMRDGLRYSWSEVEPGLESLQIHAKSASEKEAKARDILDQKCMELFSHLRLLAEIRNQQTVFAPPDKAGDETYPIAAYVQQYMNGHTNLWGQIYYFLDSQYHSGDPKEFNKFLGLVHTGLQKHMAADANKAEFEAFFNRFAPFYNSIVLYVFVFTLACCSWLVWPKSLRQAAFWLCILTFIVHTWALFCRMYLMDRWFVFVTNLYSSAIFIGWGCVAVGLFLEYVFPYGVGCVVGSVTGALSLIIAHHLSQSGDTLEMLQAVLDTDFWLATHVSCITFGYTATFVAGFLGIGYILAGLFLPNLSGEIKQNITRMTYGVTCFAMLLSFTGTVLGGLWADYSWGRFWGWDPKENGALLIVLMNALILHARWGGMVKARGMAVLAVLGNAVVAWSWFGVNMLGVGLHSYGFMEGAAFWLIAFVVSQIVLAGVGMVEPARLRKLMASALALPPKSSATPSGAAAP